ncbi:MAG: pseudouridine synthase [Comamonas sp.]|nr:pseudouridine synthase [Comamonas sp.]
MPIHLLPPLPPPALPSTGNEAAAHPDLHLVYQDADLAVVYKPAGWLVHRSSLARHETRITLQRLRDQLGQHVWPVHRLDQGTCGLLVFALNAWTCQQLAQDFAAQQVGKQYLALVRGWLAQSLEVTHPLRPQDGAPSAPAQSAHTSLHPLATLDWPHAFDARHPSTRISLVLAQPHTGRQHQIRRHLKHVAHPILGDSTHGKGALNRWWAQHLGGQRLWLHAHALDFTHPRTGQRLHLVAHWQDLAHLPEVQQWQHALALPGWQWQASSHSSGLAPP